MRLVVAITGASGVIYGKRLLEVLKEKNVETILVISKQAEKILKMELDIKREDLVKLAAKYYDSEDMGAPISSGSFKFDAMIIVPCSMKTLASIACGIASNLIVRAADVAIKEGRKLILVPREAPLSPIHLRNMLFLSEIGVIIIPASPAFYHKPKTVKDLVDFVVGRILDVIGLKHELYKPYEGNF